LNSTVIVRAPLHVQVAERLRILIDSGELAPGARLNEIELCNTMGVSRTPLREAIRSLATEGLIELQPNRGAIVSVVSQENVTEILPIMASLEGLGGRLAAMHMDQSKIAQVRKIHNQMISHYKNNEVAEYFETNRLIHELITEGSGNQTLVDTINSLSAKVRRARFTAQMTKESWAKAVSEHEEMIAALEAQDPDRLEAILVQHVETKRATILGSIEQSQKISSD
jgi:DNA-binding GntR family transcriptional regulator